MRSGGHEFLGDDQTGVTLEVMAVETETGYLVIHAIPIRDRYLPYLKGADDDQA